VVSTQAWRGAGQTAQQQQQQHSSKRDQGTGKASSSTHSRLAEAPKQSKTPSFQTVNMSQVAPRPLPSMTQLANFIQGNQVLKVGGQNGPCNALASWRSSTGMLQGSQESLQQSHGKGSTGGTCSKYSHGSGQELRVGSGSPRLHTRLEDPAPPRSARAGCTWPGARSGMVRLF